jgi:hypothetical protein
VRPTGSKIHRLWKCPASAALRQFADDNPAAEPARGRGKAIHAFLQRVGTVERAQLLADAPAELVPLLEALDLENLPVGLATEVPYAWNWRQRTARWLGADLPLRPDGGVDYDYEDHPAIIPVDWDSEIPCTLDVVGVAQLRPPGHENYGPTRGYVGDYKSGRSKYPPPDMFGQTLLGAACVAHVHGCDDVVVELIHIHDNGGHHTVRRIVNTWDLEDFADQLYASMERAKAALREGGLTPYEKEHLVKEGPWCEHCPAYRGCPAKLALVRALPQELAAMGLHPEKCGLPVDAGTCVLPYGHAGHPQDGGCSAHGANNITRFDPAALTVSNAAGAWMAIERIEDVLAEAKKELCWLAWHETIPLPDGRVLGRLETSKRAVNGKVAAELLERRYGASERAARVEVSVTLAALRQAAVAHLQKGEKLETRNKTGVYDRLLDELERDGGLETRVTDAVRPHVPKRK